MTPLFRIESERFICLRSIFHPALCVRSCWTSNPTCCRRCRTMRVTSSFWRIPVNRHGKCLIVTEEPTNNSFARSLAGLIQEKCFKFLDAPVMVIGSENMPAIPLNSTLEFTMIPNVDKVKAKMDELLNY